MSSRLRWSDLPEEVRRRVEELVGGPVVRTRSATGGFSRSSAEIVTGPEERELFVKAVTPRINTGSDTLNRREADALRRMPASIPAPALLDAFSCGDWFVLVIEAVEGRMPRQPWVPEELDAALDALHRLRRTATPTPVSDLPTLEESLGGDLRGFDRVAADLPTDLDPWIIPRLAALRAAAGRGIAALAGSTLCHSDLRADNILLTEDGSALLVDWAWASRGSAFADALQLLSSIPDPSGVLDVDGRIDRLMDGVGEPREVATDVLVGILGFFVDAARWPEDPSLPALGAHRRASRDSLFPLVTARWEREGRV
ncbi:phosphotransferase [Brachybacterium sp. YJGR34]|uniref:phosphotransferase n=1 Tax=Brachybacterium sp. YJGR34 TaxID=2059911 RepID=UPI000E0B454D|nr:phosphotransferase [Brachybacterium sp. YJGR34]